jgi:hypothetical protein
MKNAEKVDLKDTIVRSYFLMLAILPLILVSVLAFTLFVDFLGTQANEIARLVHDLEVQCEYEIGLRNAGNGFFQCGTFVPKILLFFVLVLSWVVVSAIVTIRLFEFVPLKSLRLPLTILVAISVPALLLVKYLLAIKSFSSFAIFYGGEAFIATLLVFIYFDRLSSFARNSHIFLIIFVACIALFVGISVLFAFYNPNIFNSLGTLNTILLSLILIYAFTGGLFFYSRVTGIPLVTGLAAWILIINFSGLNHREPVELTPADSAGQITGPDQFVKWLEGRSDRQVYQGKEYPVYIVAAAGGGTYAAIRTAYMLDYLQRICPSFPHHIFAISSVSGGGLGALAYVAQQQAQGAPDLRPCISPDLNLNAIADQATGPSIDSSVLDQFFAKDLLSTLVGSGLFPDMLQRIIPMPLPQLDRSVAFRNALGQHWRDALKAPVPPAAKRGFTRAAISGCTPEAYFNDCEITRYWKPEGDVPIMVFNTTHVDTGAPIVLSNLSSEFYPNALAAVNQREFTTRSIRLIDAASLSARYPVALPAGFLQEDVKTSHYVRLVDGGYFDTSGLITAEAIKTKIEAIAAERNLAVKVRLIFLGELTETSPDSTASIAGTAAASAPASPATVYAQLRATPDNPNDPIGSEIGAHFIALVQSGYQRTTFVVSRFLRTIKDTLAIRWDPASKVAIKPYCPDVPLAWYLAPCTLELTRSRLDDSLRVASEPELAALRADLAR